MSQNSPRILIVADDLTGGNACGALFAEAGLRDDDDHRHQQSAIGQRRRPRSMTMTPSYVNANSRHLKPAEAAEL